MSDWDDDDYDPTAQMADKIAVLGLDNVVRQNKTAAVAHQGSRDEGGAKSETAKKPVNDPKNDASLFGGGTDIELTEEEKREAQLRTDGMAAMDLFGLTAERKEPTFDDLRSKADFAAFGEKLGEQFAARQADPNYLSFANLLIDHLTKPMTKLQLQTIQATVQTHLDVFLKREEEQLKRQQEQKKQKETKKTKTQQIQEDVVDDEYDDYDEKFHRY